ncbi:cadmium resistance transporter [Mycolicibacterium sphagni]|uniref:cadmium resistance transporter n=1 Tax=Mycolicibacterium sphagni TaxID=1786 RepID=UPI001F24DCDD|nr:cadmium resistance transporter [Mycolicibacterium sphagni]
MIAQAAVLFALTNIDDLVVLAVFFGRAGRHRPDQLRVIAGQYLGFCGILTVSIAGALGVSLLPHNAIPYLGLLPLSLGIRAGWQAWRSHTSEDDDSESPRDRGSGVLEVATVTFANGGDNVGAYVPVFAVVGAASISGYVGIFLICVALWCAAGLFLASRPPVAKLLTGWSHVILPVVLISIGLAILFGL